MTIKKRWIIFVVMVLVGIGNMPIYSAAETDKDGKIAVSLVIDTSGSMKETDPTNLRKTAADIFVDLLSPDDYVGIVSFSTDVTELVPMQQVGNATNKQVIKDTLTPIVNADGNTNYQVALQKAEQQLESYAEEDVRKIIIFLTDGVPEPDYALREDAAFMSSYMESLWQTTSQLGLKNFAVYALGFGTADPSTLQRIASETRGEAKFLGNANEIAINFFEVLRTLKNRQGFWNETMAVPGETVLPFQIDGYDSQVTLAVMFDTSGMDAVVRSMNGVDSTGKMNIQKTESYSILTINQTDKELAGEWELVLSGTGTAQLFGDKDLNLKAWMQEPKANVQLALGEPIDIAVSVTGEITEDMTVAVLITKNGSPETETVPLVLKDSTYVARYENIDQAGTYTLETQISEKGNAITSTATAVSVQQLPTVTSEELLQDVIYKLSEKQFVTGSLVLDDIPLVAIPELTITSFNLIEYFSDGRQEIHPMLDSDSEKSGDSMNGDGIYSHPLSLDEEGDFTASLVVQGTYRGGAFILEKELGNYQVVSGGMISGTFDEAELFGKPGGEVIIPVQIENNSGRSETVRVSLLLEKATSEEQTLTLEAGEKVETSFLVELADDMPLEKQFVLLELSAEDPLTNVVADERTSIAVLSGNALFIRNLNIFLSQNKLLIGSILITPVLIFILGRILYALKMKKTLQITRSLKYSRTEKLEEVNELLLPKKPGKLLLAMGEATTDANVFLAGPKIPYLLTIEIAFHPSRRKWLEGLRSLSKAQLPVNITVVTTPPGIFKLNGEIYTNKQIFDQDVFESGGYRFTYKAEKTVMEEDKARNLLEGKM